MLRRTVKKREAVTKDTIKEKKIRTQVENSSGAPLGLERRKKKELEEKVLEGLVLGGENDIIEQLEAEPKKIKIHKKKAPSSASFVGDEKKPVWEDEDDLVGSVDLTKRKRFSDLRQGEECRVRTEQYTTRLKSQFEKVSSTPNWAKLPSERNVSSDDDSDVEDLLHSTGNYLATSSALPKSIIQIKQCTNANSEYPAQGKLTSVEFHPSAQVILTAGMNQTLSLFQVDGEHNPKIQSVFLDNYPIHTAHFSTDGQEVIIGSKHSNFKYYDMIAGKIITVPKIKGIEQKDMKRFVVSPDGKYITFLGHYGSIHMLSAKSKEWIYSLKMNGSVESVAFSKDSSRMYSHGDDGQVYVWDINTRDCIHKFTDDGCIQGTTVDVSHDGQYLACGSYSGVVNIYDTETCMSSSYPKPIKAIMNLTTSCSKSIFHPSTELLAISSDYTEKAVKLIHIPSMTAFSNFPDKSLTGLRIPTSMDFSPHGGYFTVGTHNGSALLFRLQHYGNY